MGEANHPPPGLVTLVRRIIRTGLGALRNRLELFALEWQEERLRLTRLALGVGLLVFFVLMTALLLTFIAIFIFPPEHRMYVAGGLAALYCVAAILACWRLRTLLRHEAFRETIDQVKKDEAWLESLK